MAPITAGFASCFSPNMDAWIVGCKTTCDPVRLGGQFAIKARSNRSSSCLTFPAGDCEVMEPAKHHGFMYHVTRWIDSAPRTCCSHACMRARACVRACVRACACVRVRACVRACVNGMYAERERESDRYVMTKH